MSENEEKPEETQITEENAEITEESPATEETTEEASIESQLEEMKDKYLRLSADFDNFRKRTNKERIDLIQTASAGVLKEMVGIFDDFERANKSMETATDIEALKEGVLLIQNKFQRVLEAQGVKQMDAKGQDFDADLHECITQFPAPSEDLKNKVVDVVENGYTLYEKVLRFAKVVVGS